MNPDFHRASTLMAAPLSHPVQPATQAGNGGGAARPHPLLTLRASRGWTALDLGEIWAFRDLLFSLAGRDLKLRYKQTALGVIWVVVQPLLTALIFLFVFRKVAHVNGIKVPYFAFAFAGLLGSNFFNAVLNKVGSCLVGNAQLISKVFFPRLVLPLSSVGSALVDFAVTAVIMGLLMAWYGIVPGATVLLFPVAMLILAAIALGVGLWAAALTVSYRDVQYILPVAQNLLLYGSPVGYPLTKIPHEWLIVYLWVNPLAAPLVTLQASLLGTPLPPMWSLFASASVGAVLLGAGIFAFKRMERSFADVI